MIRTLFRKTVLAALLAAALITAYGIGAGQWKSPVRAERTGLDRITLTVVGRSVTVNTAEAKRIVSEARRIGKELLSSLPAWLLRITDTVVRAARAFLTDAGIVRPASPVPTYGVTNSTPTVFTNAGNYGNIS